MRLKGSLVVEGSYVIPFILIIIASFIFLDFRVYDGLLSDCARLSGAMKCHEARDFYYDDKRQNIDPAAIVASPVIGEDEFFNNQEKSVQNNMISFYKANRLNGKSTIAVTELDKVVRVKNKGRLLRAGEKIIQLIGGK